MTARVLIVDDHPLVRKGLITELEDASDIVVADEASDGYEAITKARQLKPDLVLLDISLPGKNGLEVLKDLQSEMPEIKVLVLTAFPERQYAVRCLKSGAKGYITKDSASTDLVKAVRKVMAGGKFISASLADLLASELGTDPHRLPHEELSDREYEILCLIGEGKNVTKIADILNLSISSVNTYRRRILVKMRMESTSQLIRYALDNNLSLIR